MRVALALAVVAASALAAGADVLDAKALGAAADGQTDDTAALQKALDRAGEAGGTVYLPSGRYLVAGSLTVPTGVCLQGAWRMPHHAAWDKCTTLLATGGAGEEDGPALIELSQSSAVRGITVYYPEQDPHNIRPYPWAIRGRGMHCTVENVTLANAYQGIAMGHEWNELHVIRNVFGCVLRRGVLVDTCTDIGRIENVHFNQHYWLRAGYPGGPDHGQDYLAYRRFMQENLECFIFGKTDWESVKDTFMYCAKIGYKFTDFGRGAMNGQLMGIGADCALYGMWVESIQHMGLVVTNGQFAAFRHPEIKADDDPLPAAVVTADTCAGSVRFVNCTFWGGNAVANLSGSPDSHVGFTDCYVRDWIAYNDVPAVYSDGPRLSVRGCTFVGRGIEVYVGSATPLGFITENTSEDEFNAIVEEPARVYVDHNISLEQRPVE